MFKNQRNKSTIRLKWKRLRLVLPKAAKGWYSGFSEYPDRAKNVHKESHYALNPGGKNQYRATVKYLYSATEAIYSSKHEKHSQKF